MIWYDRDGIVTYGDFVRADRLRSRLSWTEEEKEFLKRNYGKMPAWRIALCLGRTEAAVRSKAGEIGVRVWRRKRRRYKPPKYLIPILHRRVLP